MRNRRCAPEGAFSLSDRRFRYDGFDEFDRMMREIPNFDKRHVPREERDCPLCRFRSKDRCTLCKCPYFD